MPISVPTYKYEAFSRGGTQRRILLRPARKEEVPRVTQIYNGVIEALYESGLRVEMDHIRARLEKDPLSVLVACFENTPVGLVNVVKLHLKDEYAIPRTHQQLTDNETFASTQPEHGNTWFCYWAAVINAARGYKANIDGMNRSVGQTLAWWVKELAGQHGNVQHMYAYTRPADLRTYVEEKVESAIVFEVDEKNRTLKSSTPNWETLITKEDGVYFSSYSRYIATYQYYLMKDEPDAILNFHQQNGAEILPRSFIPYAQIHDFNSLGLRVLAKYF